MEQVEWIPAIVVLAIGGIGGAILAFRSRGTRAPVADDRALEVKERRAELEAAIAQLRELEDLASTRSPGQLDADRAALEMKAATALRELDRLEASAPAIAVDAEAISAERSSGGVSSQTRGFLWGAASVATIAILLFLVLQGSDDRAPGGLLTGGIEGAPGPMSSSPAEMLETLRAAVARNPEDLNARLDLAQALLVTQDLPGVFEQTEEVLARAPDHPRALSYQSLVRLAMGEDDVALAMARKAVALDPSNPESVVHLAVIHAQRGERPEAERLLEQAARDFPADAETLRGLLAEVRAAGGGAQPPPPSTAAPGAGVSITLELAPGTRSSGGTVFVIANPEGVTGGRPMLVRRIVVAAFPAQTAISAADSTTGSLPGRMRVDAILDSDGNPGTRGAGDLAGSVGGVVPGSSVRIRLGPM